MPMATMNETMTVTLEEAKGCDMTRASVKAKQKRSVAMTAVGRLTPASRPRKTPSEPPMRMVRMLARRER